MQLPNAIFNPAKIQRIGIILADKKAGPFELHLDYIRTYGKGQGQGSKAEPAPTPTPSTATDAQATKLNLIATLEADGRFTTFKKALDTAHLTVFFQWDNPLTLFVPTDAAFAKLPKESLTDLMLPENKDQLVALLSQHVAPGNYNVSTALAAPQIKPVKGEKLQVQIDQGMLQANHSTILEADILCSDGIIHAIDSVIVAEPTS